MPDSDPFSRRGHAAAGVAGSIYGKNQSYDKSYGKCQSSSGRSYASGYRSERGSSSLLSVPQKNSRGRMVEIPESQALVIRPSSKSEYREPPSTYGSSSRSEYPKSRESYREPGAHYSGSSPSKYKKSGQSYYKGSRSDYPSSGSTSHYGSFKSSTSDSEYKSSYNEMLDRANQLALAKRPSESQSYEPDDYYGTTSAPAYTGTNRTLVPSSSSALAPSKSGPQLGSASNPLVVRHVVHAAPEQKFRMVTEWRDVGIDRSTIKQYDYLN
ncbi:MAG: hypothetical protein M1827_004471 [Pycnora praestabilis]|nr:MAG: hypothetical protein M1827_004471 [Pycnora praestabilis]